jgi:hypothetical protein
MTTIDRFDPFERRITEAIQEIAAERRPDYLDSIFEATARSRQRPRWAVPERWIPVNRLVITAVAATLIVAVGGVLLVSFRGPQVGPSGPTPVPTASVSPTATPLIDLSRFGLGRGTGYATTAPELFIDATWISDADLVQGLFHDRRLEISTAYDDGQFVVTYQQGQVGMSSQVVAGAAEYLSLVSLFAGSGCAVGNFGDYQMILSQDGMSLELKPRRDECATRQSLLARTWTRSLDTASHGGRGVMTVFDPYVAVTLPDASYSTNNVNASANVSADSIGRTLIGVQNPTGWTEPCSDTGGTRIQLANTIDAFRSYLRTLPGFSVRSESLQIGGHAAVRLTVPTAKTPECQKAGPNKGRVVEWGTTNPDDPGFWMLAQGDTDVIYLVEVGSDLFLLQWLGAGVTQQEELQVLSTVQFLDALPTSS